MELSTAASRRASRSGALLRILPNHACATGAQHSEYCLVDGIGQISRWSRFSGW